MFEIPIATIPKSIFEVPTRFKMKKLAGRAPQSRGKMIHDDFSPGITDKLRMLSSARMLTVDNYTYEPEYLMKILDYNVKKNKPKQNDIYLSLIGHPKSMGTYSFELLDYFISQSEKEYGDEVQFITYQQASKQIRKHGY